MAQVIYEFLSNKNIIKDVTVTKKKSLLMTNKLWEDMLYLCYHELGTDLVQSCT